MVREPSTRQPGAAGWGVSLPSKKIVGHTDGYTKLPFRSVPNAYRLPVFLIAFRCENGEISVVARVRNTLGNVDNALNQSFKPRHGKSPSFVYRAGPGHLPQRMRTA